VGEDDVEEGASAGGANTLISAVQLFGVLMLTDAGKQAGMDVISEGIDCCASLTRSGITYVMNTHHLQEAVLGAVAALTSAVDDTKPAAGMPAPIANAASVALAPTPRQEREMIWCVLSSNQVIRLSMWAAVSVAASLAQDDSGGELVDQLASLTEEDEALKIVFETACDALVGTMELASSPAYKAAGDAASGALQKAVLASSRSKNSKPGTKSTQVYGSQPIIPSMIDLLAESSSSLAVCTTSTAVCAAVIPSVQNNKGEEIILNAMDLGGHAHVASSGSVSIASAIAHSLHHHHHSSKHLEIISNVFAVLDAVAYVDDSAAAPSLIKARTTQAVEQHLGKVLHTLITSLDSVGEVDASTKSEETETLLSGSIAAFHLLSALTLAGEFDEAHEAVTGGIVSMLSTAINACGDCEESTVNGSSAASMLAQPDLLRVVAMLLTKLAIP
jgi:hypothetical protein